MTARSPHTTPSDPVGSPMNVVTVLLLTLGMMLGFGVTGHALVIADPATPETNLVSDRWTSPIVGATPSSVLREFSAPSSPWGSGHRGIDLAASSEVVAPESGTVRFVGTVVDRPVLTLEHPNGLLSSFEPVSTELQVGDSVQRGQILGTISTEEHCSVNCIHWGVRIPDGWTIGSTVRDRYLDPGLLLGWSGPSVLWPLQGRPTP